MNSEEYMNLKKTEHFVYITKVSFGSHRANGLDILDDVNEMRLKRKYSNGEYCGEIIDNLMA